MNTEYLKGTIVKDPTRCARIVPLDFDEPFWFVRRNLLIDKLKKRVATFNKVLFALAYIFIAIPIGVALIGLFVYLSWEFNCGGFMGILIGWMGAMYFRLAWLLTGEWIETDPWMISFKYANKIRKLNKKLF